MGESGMAGMGRIADRLLSRGQVAIADIGSYRLSQKGSSFRNVRAWWLEDVGDRTPI